MKTLFDSSALIASCVEAHANHRWILEQIAEATGDSCFCAHALAETFAVLTAAYRLPSPTAMELVDSFTAWARIVELGTDDYELAMKRVGKARRAGGSIYDALHCVAATKSRAGRIVTLNPRDFRALAAGIPIAYP